jgi:hypothetical protein
LTIIAEIIDISKCNHFYLSLIAGDKNIVNSVNYQLAIARTGIGKWYKKFIKIEKNGYNEIFNFTVHVLKHGITH